MRLTSAERATIRAVVHKLDPSAVVYLFGSRVRDASVGGDIDLLIESKSIRFKDKISLLVDIKIQLGEQKIDIVLSNDVDKDPDPFIQSIKKEMQEL